MRVEECAEGNSRCHDHRSVGKASFLDGNVPGMKIMFFLTHRLHGLSGSYFRVVAAKQDRLETQREGAAWVLRRRYCCLVLSLPFPTVASIQH